MVMLARFAPDK